MSSGQVTRALQASVETCWIQGCPVAGGDAHQIAQTAQRRLDSFDRRAKKSKDRTARVADLTKGLIQALEAEPKLVGPLEADYIFLAESLYAAWDESGNTVPRQITSQSASNAATIYVRHSFCFVGACDQTVDGVWIGRDDIAVVPLDQNEPLGLTVLDALRESRTGIPHPGQSEWTAVRKRSLDPIVAAAGLHSWRSFVRSAQMIAVHHEAGDLELELFERDDQRADVFKPFKNRRTASPIPEPSPIGLAVAKLVHGHEVVTGDP